MTDDTMPERLPLDHPETRARLAVIRALILDRIAKLPAEDGASTPKRTEETQDAFHFRLAAMFRERRLALQCGGPPGCRIRSCCRSKRCRRRAALDLPEPGEQPKPKCYTKMRSD